METIGRTNDNQILVKMTYEEATSLEKLQNAVKNKSIVGDIRGTNINHNLDDVFNLILKYAYSLNMANILQEEVDSLLMSLRGETDEISD